jgi:hypothetical protein
LGRKLLKEPTPPKKVRHDAEMTLSHQREEAVRNAQAWFEVNSGWAPPDEDTMAEWEADGVCRCPDECLVAPDAWCAHGLASWRLILAALDLPGSS